MTGRRDDFMKYLAQTSNEPDGLEVLSAEGAWIKGADGKRYLDLLGGIGVANTGHRHPQVIDAIRVQLNRHLHVMVWGEYVQEAQVEYAKLLCGLAPMAEARVYFTNSGAEAVEGALKVARKATGRKKLVAFEGSYHGDTMGALSVLGVPALRAPFEPLLPDVAFLPFGDLTALSKITKEVAGVIVEPIQAEGGVRVPGDGFLPALRKRCDDTGALLILDEVQTGMGRTGTLWAGDHWGVKPDVLVLAKALGGGLPLGAFLATSRLMRTLAVDPPLTHLTTFGGHPVSCAAGKMALELTMGLDLPARAARLGELALDRLAGLAKKGTVAAVRGRGLLLGIECVSVEQARKLVAACRGKCILVGQSLHDEKVLRLTPPLIIREKDFAYGLGLLATAAGKASK
ncbi:MAG: aspartate aminotransferase family protein [Candidatus Coatesbacteria bacterium]